MNTSTSYKNTHNVLPNRGKREWTYFVSMLCPSFPLGLWFEKKILGLGSVHKGRPMFCDFWQYLLLTYVPTYVRCTAYIVCISFICIYLVRYSLTYLIMYLGFVHKRRQNFLAVFYTPLPPKIFWRLLWMGPYPKNHTSVMDAPLYRGLWSNGRKSSLKYHGH